MNSKVNINVSLNKRQTKYITPEGKEIVRTSEYKKVLGDKWSMYNIGMYKGRDNAFNILSAHKELIETRDGFKKIFNQEVSDNKNKSLDRGSLYHDEIEIAFGEKNYIAALSMLIDMDIDGEKVTNPFAPMYIKHFKETKEQLLAVEQSFTIECEQGEWGGKIDTLTCQKDDQGNITHITNIDNKTSKLLAHERYDDTYLEYGLQMAGYRKPMCRYYGIPYEKYTAKIFWEDGEITEYSKEILDLLEELFFLNIRYADLTRKNLSQIKVLRGA